MPAKTLYIVQQFDRVGKRIVVALSVAEPVGELWRLIPYREGLRR